MSDQLDEIVEQAATDYRNACIDEPLEPFIRRACEEWGDYVTKCMATDKQMAIAKQVLLAAISMEADKERLDWLETPVGKRWLMKRGFLISLDESFRTMADDAKQSMSSDET